MQPVTSKKSLMQRQIPTLVGLGILVIGLIAGIVFLGNGPGVFAPRATPETTPKKIKVTNVTDTGFTISFMTDDTVAGFVKYGTEEDALKTQASDDRDQLTGTIGTYQMHHVTVRGLKPNTTYFYSLGTGTRALYDNNGKPFQIKTAQRGGAPSAAKTAYGSVVTQNGAPADGAVVYVSIPGVGEMSSLVKSSGSWAIPLSNARTPDGSAYAALKDTDTMTIMVQGAQASQTASLSTTIAQAQPVPAITFGQATADSSEDAPTSTSPTEEEPEPSEQTKEETPSTQNTNLGQAQNASDSATASSSARNVGGGLNTLLSQSNATTSASTAVASAAAQAQAQENAASTSAVLDLSKGSNQVITTGQPIITGIAAPRVKVKIQVNSETRIEQELIADDNGEFELDIEALKKDLEPGEHSATYSYIDPNTGKTVTKTVTFTVEAPVGSNTTQQLSQTTNDYGQGGPYGSGNPFPASGSASPSPSSIASSSSTATRSALPSTSSAIPVSGSVGTTAALVIGGLFFILAGVWSYWLSLQLGRAEIET